jgi:hypothetical protein
LKSPLILDAAEFKKFIENNVMEADPTYRRAMDAGWGTNLFATRFLFDLVKWTIQTRVLHAQVDPVEPDPPTTRTRINLVVTGGREVDIPDGLQSPALELSEDEIRIAMFTFQSALKYLKEALPETRILVVYLPSPLASYEISSATVSVQTYEGRSPLYPSSKVGQRSDEICGRAADAAAELGVQFLDSRPFVRQTASRVFVHGPQDWKHFNRNGYEALARAVLAGLSEKAGSGCGPSQIHDTAPSREW